MNNICMKRNSKCLADYAPDLVKQWHPTKNGKLTPQDVPPRSGKKAWWYCNKCKYEWLAVINNRIRCSNCPACSGRVVTENNCLAVVCPELAKEWHPTKNLPLTPFDISLRSNQKIWWECVECGYEWISTPLNRTQRGRLTKCFNCNSVFVKFPELIKEWHLTKNGKLTPKDVQSGSNKGIWWKCSKCEYEWRARSWDRHKGEKSCPKCSCLSTQNPGLAKEWHPTKNGKLTPYGVSYGSKLNVWWKCSRCEYEWKAMVYARSGGEGMCPGCHSLGVKSPALAKEWHPTKNGKLTPYDLSYRSSLSVWWKCSECGHEWLARPQSRQDGCGCPRCCMVILKDGTACSSLVDAHFYLLFKQKGIAFLYNKMYENLGQHRYDFYLPEENKYIEVTGFNKKGYESITGKPWTSYLDKIAKKKEYVESIGAKFEFIQKTLSAKETAYIRTNMRKHS